MQFEALAGIQMLHVSSWLLVHRRLFLEIARFLNFFFSNLILSDPREIHELQASIKLELYCSGSWKRYYP